MSQQNPTLKKAMLQALEKTLGIVTGAAKMAGIDRTTHYEWLKTDPEYKEAVESIGDMALDFAESHLHTQIENNEIASTIFYLKTKGKKRGYIERIENELSQPGGKALFDGMSNDQLAQELRALTDKLNK